MFSNTTRLAPLNVSLPRGTGSSSQQRRVERASTLAAPSAQKRSSSQQRPCRPAPQEKEALGMGEARIEVFCWILHSHLGSGTRAARNAGHLEVLTIFKVLWWVRAKILHWTHIFQFKNDFLPKRRNPDLCSTQNWEGAGHSRNLQFGNIKHDRLFFLSFKSICKEIS